MENINSILLIAQVLLSITLIGLILIQHGKGADAGAAFGSGASATVFGARGSGNFLSKATAIIAIMFFVVSLSLAYLAANREGPESVIDSVTAVEKETQRLGTGASDLPPAYESGTASSDSDLPPAD